MSSLHSPPTRTRKRLLLAVLALAQLIISIDYNIVYVALPEIGRSVGLADQALQWVISAYAITFGGFLLLGGRASDVVGPRRLFIAGLGLYGIASLLGGMASTPELLVAARALQGLGGALLFPATLTLVNTRFDEGGERMRAYAVWATAGGSGMILGSLLGGLLTQFLGWTAVFFVNVPLAAVGIIGALGLVHKHVPRGRERSLNILGSITVTVAVTALVTAVIQASEFGWVSIEVGVFALVGVCLLVVFVALERRSRTPLVPRSLLSDRNLRVGALVTFLYMATFGTVLYFLTLYFQTVQGFNALQTGLGFLIPMAAIVAGAQAVGPLSGRFGLRNTIALTLAVGAVGTFIVGCMATSTTSYLALVPGLAIMGFGQGAGYTLMFRAATLTIASDSQGIASGIASTAQQLGGAVGLAVLVGIALSTGADSANRAAEAVGLQNAILVASAGILATALISLRFDPAKAKATPPTNPITPATSIANQPS